MRARGEGQRAGFTLIELLAVILIIGILMTFLLPRIPEAIDAGSWGALGAEVNHPIGRLHHVQIVLDH